MANLFFGTFDNSRQIIKKLYSCKQCGIGMFLESFTDEQTTLEMIKQDPYCNECEKIQPKSNEESIKPLRDMLGSIFS